VKSNLTLQIEVTGAASMSPGQIIDLLKPLVEGMTFKNTDGAGLYWLRVFSDSSFETDAEFGVSLCNSSGKIGFSATTHGSVGGGQVKLKGCSGPKADFGGVHTHPGDYPNFSLLDIYNANVLTVLSGHNRSTYLGTQTGFLKYTTNRKKVLSNPKNPTGVHGKLKKIP